MPRGVHNNHVAGPGRPKGSRNRLTIKKQRKLAQLAEAHTPQAIKALVEVMTTETGGPKVTAAIAILDRAFGRPKTQIDVNRNVEHNHSLRIDPDTLSDEALEELYHSMTAAAKAISQAQEEHRLLEEIEDAEVVDAEEVEDAEKDGGDE